MLCDEDEKVPTYHKRFGYYWPLFVTTILTILFVCIFMYAHSRATFYDALNAKTLRSATIVDAWPYNTGKHGTGREEWEGTFRDDITGHFYTYAMGGGLYQKFLREKSGKGIPATVWISPSRAGVPEAVNADHMEDVWFAARVFSGLISVVLLVLSVCNVHEGYTWTKRKREEEAEQERQKQIDRDKYLARTKRNQRGLP